MVEFSYVWGAVYVFENPKAQRVKVGMTTTNNVEGRLSDVNDMWLQRKVTCQICGGRLNNTAGFVPRDFKSGMLCPGERALPLEKDVTRAEIYLKSTKDRLSIVSGTEKGSISRIVKTLEKRIEKFRQYDMPAGEWQLRTAFYTERCEQVESLAHQILSERLDKLAPFGEVFCCSASEATEAVASALSQLGLLQSARKETPNN